MYGGVSNVTVKRDKLLSKFQQLNAKKKQEYEITLLQCFRTHCADGTEHSQPSSRFLKRGQRQEKLIAPTLPYFKHWPLLSLMTEPSMTPSIFGERAK